jgi:iron complex transport system substrate-binding protein
VRADSCGISRIMTRVVSLVPAGTEIVAALGAERLLVGVSHECDWPASVRGLPRVTTTPIDPSSSSLAIDRRVRELASGGKPVIAVNPDVLASLEPDVIIVQDVCAVCAATEDGLSDLSAAMPSSPRRLALSARTLDGIFRDIATVGRALELPTMAAGLITGLRERLEALSAGAGLERPRVVCLEWLDPVFLAGHWVPDLIRAAGGNDVGAIPGAHSVQATLERVRDLAPDVVLVAPCGMGLAQGQRELQGLERRMKREGVTPISEWGAAVWVLDGNAYTSRPGPRVVEAAELIAWALGGVERPGLIRWASGTHRRGPAASQAGLEIPQELRYIQG